MSRDLVPGDVISIPSGVNMPCDVILVKGECLVNESMITGESMSICKNALSPSSDAYSPKDTSSFIFSGTVCVTSRSPDNRGKPATGVVYQTGFHTTKGTIIRSVMYEDPAIQKYEKDSSLFMIGLMVMGVVFMIIFLIIAVVVFLEKLDWE